MKSTKRNTAADAAPIVPARDFTIDTCRSRFEVETSYRVLVPPGPAPAGGRPLVVCLHGMGMGGETFRLLLNDLVAPPAVWLFPDGVYPYEIRKDGAIRIGHAWYIYDGSEEPFRSTLTRTEEYLFRLIEEIAERTPIDKGRVWLLGFSQGAYTGFHAAIRNVNKVAGLVAISGRMKAEFLVEELRGERKIPILMIHGEKDRSITVERARESYQILADHGFPVEMKTFPVGHMMQAVEIEAIRDWLHLRLS